MIKKSIMLKMLMLFVSSSLFMFSQQNEIYNKIQINVASKNPTKDAKTSFGGFFNEAKALVYLYNDPQFLEGRQPLIVTVGPRQLATSSVNIGAKLRSDIDANSCIMNDTAKGLYSCVA